MPFLIRTTLPIIECADIDNAWTIITIITRVFC